MKIIKIISKVLNPLFTNYDGDVFSEKSFDYNISTNDTCYIVEISPDINNAINYTGVILALKIYFSLIRKKFNNFKIVLCGFEDKLTFYQDCEHSMFLKCPGIEYHQIGLNCQIDTNVPKTVDLEQAIESLKSIKINPPSSYKTHHSTANEWALIRYFSMLEKDSNNDGYNKLAQKINELDYTETLYFQYHEALNTRDKFKKPKHLYTPDIKYIENLSIGIIDDETEKGYGAFYTYLLKKSGASTTTIFPFRKGEDKNKMIERLQEWIKEQNIDIFIIDLRLHDSDFYEKTTSNLSGIQIIKYIKSNNKGIQIIVSTASNKTWNMKECMKYGVNSYFVKESPENFNSRSETKQSLIHLTKEIEKSAKNIFLAEMYRKIDDIKSNNFFKKIKKEQEFQDIVFSQNGLLDQLFELLNVDTTNDSILNQCLLICFQILEKYCDLDSVGDFGKKDNLSSGAIFRKDDILQEIFVNQEHNKILTRFELKYGCFYFQQNNKEGVIGFNKFNDKKLISTYQTGLEISFITKMISALYFRDNISENRITEIIKLRYYRSNVSAHFTGNVDISKYKITAKEIDFFVNEIFYKILT